MARRRNHPFGALQSLADFAQPLRALDFVNPIARVSAFNPKDYAPWSGFDRLAIRGPKVPDLGTSLIRELTKGISSVAEPANSLSAQLREMTRAVPDLRANTILGATSSVLDGFFKSLPHFDFTKEATRGIFDFEWAGSSVLPRAVIRGAIGGAAPLAVSALLSGTPRPLDVLPAFDHKLGHLLQAMRPRDLLPGFGDALASAAISIPIPARVPRPRKATGALRQHRNRQGPAPKDGEPDLVTCRVDDRTVPEYLGDFLASREGVVCLLFFAYPLSVYSEKLFKFIMSLPPPASAAVLMGVVHVLFDTWKKRQPPDGGAS